MSDLHSGRTLAIVSIIFPLPGFKHAIYHAHATSPSTCCLITWKANIGTDFLTNFCLQHWRLNCELSCILSKTHDTLRAVLTIPLMVDTVRYWSNLRLVDILDGTSLKQRSDRLSALKSVTPSVHCRENQYLPAFCLQYSHIRW